MRDARDRHGPYTSAASRDPYPDWAFNETYPVPGSATGWWVTPYHFGIDQGPVILMIENHRTGLIWEIMRRCPYVLAGLRRAGFQRGWL